MRIREHGRDAAHRSIGVGDGGGNALRRYRLRHGIVHLHAGGRSDVAAEAMTAFATYLDRYKLPSAAEAVATLSKDLQLTERRCGGDALAPWVNWFALNATLFEQAENADEARDWTIHTAVEHGDDSPVGDAAESWLANCPIPHWHLRNEWRPRSWRAGSVFRRSLNVQGPIGEGRKVVGYKSRWVACLREDGALHVFNAESGSRQEVEGLAVVAVDSGARGFVALAADRRLVGITPGSLRQEVLGQVDFDAAHLRVVQHAIVLLGAERAEIVAAATQLLLVDNQPGEPIGIEPLDETSFALVYSTEVIVFSVDGIRLASVAPGLDRIDAVVALGEGRFLVIESRDYPGEANDPDETDAVRESRWTVYDTLGVKVARASFPKNEAQPLRVAPRRSGGVWAALSDGHLRALALDGAKIEDERSIPVGASLPSASVLM
jgi:hypothetical protein